MQKKSGKGIVYMVPLPVAEGASQTLSPDVLRQTAELRHYFVENARTARRFLRSLHQNLVLEEIQFSEIDKHSGADTHLLKKWLGEGESVGVMSEAGCPGVADPGSVVAMIAHEMGAKVIPLTGPSAILLALMASGLNGQSFAFHGYLPVKEPARGKRIKELEALSQKDRQTQIFIETPYRNSQMMADLVKNCQPRTKICMAMDVSGEGEWIATRTAAEWKAALPEYEKKPAVFLLLG